AAGGLDPNNLSAKPIRYADGTVSLQAVDLASEILDARWGQARSWSNDVAYTSRGMQGHGWVATQLPILIQNSTTTLSVIEHGTTSHVFDQSGSVFPGRNYDPTKFDYDSTAGEYVMTDAAGNQTRFLDFGTGRTPVAQGSFSSFRAPSGTTVEVTSRED